MGILSSDTDVANALRWRQTLLMGKGPRKKQPTAEDLARGRRIRHAAKSAGETFASIAEQIGITRSAVSQWASGLTDVDNANMRKLASITGFNYEWLSTASGPETSPGHLRSEDVALALGPQKPAGRTLRVKGYLGADSKAGFYALADDAYTEIPALPGDPPNAAALEILGSSAGRWLNRWYAVFDEVLDEVTPDMIGQPCVVWLSDGRVLVKEVRRNGKFYDLYSNDPAEPIIAKVRIAKAARVIGMRPK